MIVWSPCLLLLLAFTQVVIAAFPSPASQLHGTDLDELGNASIVSTEESEVFGSSADEYIGHTTVGAMLNFSNAASSDAKNGTGVRATYEAGVVGSALVVNEEAGHANHASIQEAAGMASENNFKKDRASDTNFMTHFASRGWPDFTTTTRGSADADESKGLDNSFNVFDDLDRGHSSNGNAMSSPFFSQARAPEAISSSDAADSAENSFDSFVEAPRELSSLTSNEYSDPLPSSSIAFALLPLSEKSVEVYANATRSLTAPSTSSSCYSTTSTTFCGKYAYTYSTRYSYRYSYTYSVKYSYTYSYRYSYTYSTRYSYRYSYTYGYTYSYTYAYTSYYTYSYTCSYTYSYRYSYTYSYTYYYTCSYRYSYSCSCGKGCTRTCYGTRYSTCSGTGYGTAYATGYGTRYYTCYGRRYYTAYATGYGTRYATGYGTRYATKYNTAYATGYRTGYATKYVTAYATAYATKYSTAYATATCSVCYCAGGYYSPYGIAAATGTCSSCPSGQYSSGNGNTGCTSCSGGKYQDSSAQTSCKTCPAGYYCPTGSSNTKTCPAGYYCPASVATYSACPAGLYANSGASSCTACSSGRFSSSSAQAACNVCNSGQYQASPGQTGCKTCPSGYFCATTGLSAYSACSTGTYSGSGAASCSDCAAGKYSDNTASTSCTSCEAGKYGASSGASSCIACPSGQWALSTGQTVCAFTSSPTPVPTPMPSAKPSPSPSPRPTPLPTATPHPSAVPTQVPTPSPTPLPSPAPSPLPSGLPTPSPTPLPSPEPSPLPSGLPTPSPTTLPSPEPSPLPSGLPSPLPSSSPTPLPSSVPTPLPSGSPTPLPSPEPSPVPTLLPTPSPTSVPSPAPTPVPTLVPSAQDAVSVAVSFKMTMPIDLGEVTRARYDSFKSVTGNSIGCSAGDLKNIDIATAVVESGGDSSRRRSLLTAGVNGTNSSYVWSTSFVAVSSLSAVGFITGVDWALSMVSVLETDSFEVSLEEGLVIDSVVVSDVVCIFLTNSPTQVPSLQPKPGSEPGAIANASTSFLLGVALMVAMGVAGVVWALKRKKHPKSGSGLTEDDWLSSGKSESGGKSSLYLGDPESGDGVRTSRDLELVDLHMETLGNELMHRPVLQNVADFDLQGGALLAEALDGDEEVTEGTIEGGSGSGSAKARYLKRLQARRAQSANSSANDPNKDSDASIKQAAMSSSSSGAPAETSKSHETATKVDLVAQQDANAKAGASGYGHNTNQSTSNEHMSLFERLELPEGVPLIPPNALALKPKPFAKISGAKLFKGKFKGRTVMAKRAIADDLDTFRREVALLSSLPAHPHLLLLFGVAELEDNSEGTSVDSSSLHLIGGFCGGGTLGLRCRLPSFGPLDFVRCGQEILGALAHIHTCGHWHGDLRLEHVLLDNCGAVRLTGFSSDEPFDAVAYLAKSDAAAPAGLSSRYRSPAYVPPEFWAAVRETKSAAQAGSDAMSLEQHQQADVYAAAVTLWELWHKSEPFQGVAPRDVAERVRNGDRPSFVLPEPELTSDNVPAPRAPFKAPKRLTALVHASWAHAPASRLLAHGLHAAFTSRAAPAIELAVEAESKQVLSAASETRPGVLADDAINLAEGDHPSSSSNVPIAYTWRSGRPVFKAHMSGRPVAALGVRIPVSTSSKADTKHDNAGFVAPGTTEGTTALDETGLEVAQLAALAKHPHVLTVYGVYAMTTLLDWSGPGVSEGAEKSPATLFVVADFVTGGTGGSGSISDLASYCQSGDQFTLAEFARVGRELLSGLAHLHAHGIAHGNLRPSTVLVERRHRHGYRVKLADYGVVALHSSPSAASDSKSGGAKKLGMFEDPKRVPYMSPEQFEARKAETSGDGGAKEKLGAAQAADMYALGVTLWELWFRASPFAGLSRSQVVKHVCGGSRLPFQDVPADSSAAGTIQPAPAMPEALSGLVKKCWAQVPTQRLLIEDAVPSFDEFCASIGQASGSQENLTTAADGSADGKCIEGEFGEKGDAAAVELVERMDPEVQALLHSARLWRYAPHIADLGFGDDLELFNDQDLLDDRTLLGPSIGMSKLDIRRLRGAQNERRRQGNSVLPVGSSAGGGRSLTANRLQAKMREQEALEASVVGRLDQAQPENLSIGLDDEDDDVSFNLGTGI